jgi:hypothetical protein
MAQHAPNFPIQKLQRLDDVKRTPTSRRGSLANITMPAGDVDDRNTVDDNKSYGQKRSPESMTA